MMLERPSTSDTSTLATMCPACTFTSWETQDDAIDRIWEHVQAEHPSTARRFIAASRSDVGRDKNLVRGAMQRGPTQEFRSIGKIPAAW